MRKAVYKERKSWQSIHKQGTYVLATDGKFAFWPAIITSNLKIF